LYLIDNQVQFLFFKKNSYPDSFLFLFILEIKVTGTRRAKRRTPKIGSFLQISLTQAQSLLR